MSDVGMAMDRAQTKVETLQARAGAIDELIDSGALQDFTGSGSDIDRQLAEVSSGAQVDTELEAMKRELGAGGTSTQIGDGKASA